MKHNNVNNSKTIVIILQQQANWGQKTENIQTKLFDMSISKPIISVYTANNSTNTFTMMKPKIAILISINFKTFHNGNK